MAGGWLDSFGYLTKPRHQWHTRVRSLLATPRPALLPLTGLQVLQRVVPAAEVEIVGNGALALAAVHRTRFDLVLMDIHMPGGQPPCTALLVQA